MTSSASNVVHLRKQHIYQIAALSNRSVKPRTLGSRLMKNRRARGVARRLTRAYRRSGPVIGVNQTRGPDYRSTGRRAQSASPAAILVPAVAEIGDPASRAACAVYAWLVAEGRVGAGYASVVPAAAVVPSVPVQGATITRVVAPLCRGGRARHQNA